MKYVLGNVILLRNTGTKSKHISKGEILRGLLQAKYTAILKINIFVNIVFARTIDKYNYVTHKGIQ
jgi:hypothetical protein